jgi:hypothetical protein
MSTIHSEFLNPDPGDHSVAAEIFVRDEPDDDEDEEEDDGDGKEDGDDDGYSE